MRRFMVFTLLYLALRTCFAAIASQQPDAASRLKSVLFTNAGIAYFFAMLHTSQFWQQAVLNYQRKRREQAAWRQKLSAITPWLLIAVALSWFGFTVLTEHRTTYAIGLATSTLTFILFYVEYLSVTHRNALLSASQQHCSNHRSQS